MKDRRLYEEECEVYCTDKEQTLPAEILDFVPEKFLSVSIQRSLRLSLNYNPKHNEYVGSMGGLEFTSNGPIELNVNRIK